MACLVQLTGAKGGNQATQGLLLGQAVGGGTGLVKRCVGFWHVECDRLND